MVYVISQNEKPLMPCSNPIARLLLKQGKAKVKKREPFTIKLTYETTNYVQDRPLFSVVITDVYDHDTELSLCADCLKELQKAITKALK